jgi:vancomycin resistance protein YoaR
MKKQLSFPIHPLLAAVVVVGAFLAVLLGAYGITRWLSSGEVMGRVQVAELDLGGRTEAEAATAINALEVGRLTRKATFVVDGNPVVVEAGRTGFTIDDEGLLAQAMAVGREGNFATQFLFWLGHIFSTTRIDMEGSVDDAAMTEIFDAWDSEVIGKPVHPGSIELDGDELVPIYPATGVAVQRESASDLVLATLLSADLTTPKIPTVTIEPELTSQDVDAALSEAKLMLAGPITLAFEDHEATLSVAELEDAFVSETVTKSPPQIVNSFDPAVIDRYLAPIRTEFEDPPVDARFEINDDDTVSVVPGENGTRIDEVETAQRLYEAAFVSDRTAKLPIVEGADPEVTTEYLESLDVRHLVVRFTTYHNCCEDRNVNIDTMADTIDGKLLLPGETFSINDYVGERTLEKGYLPAPSIVGGEIVDTVGGGTSQFATTMYNAVFWGGYEDVDHKPHSHYYSRYPEGIEATLFWRSIDLKFRDNRDSAILIRTSHTSTSVTVSFYGFNDGRTLVGEQSGGATKVSVKNEGGPDALHVHGDRSDRYNITQPPEPKYKANPDLAPDQQIQTQSEREGWSIDVTRQIFKGNDTDLVEEQKWVVRYSPIFAVYEVHPCMMPDTEVTCPSTTTIPPSTTTTTAGGGETTTTVGG